jgi:hypothetical protein
MQFGLQMETVQILTVLIIHTDLKSYRIFPTQLYRCPSLNFSLAYMQWQVWFSLLAGDTHTQ